MLIINMTCCADSIDASVCFSAHERKMWFISILCETQTNKVNDEHMRRTSQIEWNLDPRQKFRDALNLYSRDEDIDNRSNFQKFLLFLLRGIL